jgi:hypothetical protein
VNEDEFLMLAPSNRVETQENAITNENVPFTTKRVSTKQKTTEGPRIEVDPVQPVTKSFSSRYRQPEVDNTTPRTRINVAMFRGSVKKPKAQNNDIEDENYPEEFKQRLKAKVDVDEPVEVATKPRDVSVEKEFSTDAPTVVRRKVKKLRKVLRTTSTQATPSTRQPPSTVTFRTLLRRTTTSTTESATSSTEKSRESPLEMSRNRKRLYTPREFSKTDDAESPKMTFRFRPKSTTSSYRATIPVLGTVKPFIRSRANSNLKFSNEIILDEAESVSRT